MTRRPKAIVDAVHTVVELLEVRRLLTTVTLTADGVGNTFDATLNASTQNVDFSLNGTAIQSVPKDQVSLIKVNIAGSDGYDNTLVVDAPGVTLPVDGSGAPSLAVEVSRGGVALNAAQALANIVIHESAVLSMTGDVSSPYLYIYGQFQHTSGTLDASYVNILAGGAFIDAGGSIAHTGGLSIYNSGTFKAAFAGSLVNTTGTFHHSGLFIEDAGSGNTNTVGMSFINEQASTFNLVSGTAYLPNFYSNYSTHAALQIDGTAGALRLPQIFQNELYTQTGGTLTVDGGFELRANANFNGGTLNAQGMGVGWFTNSQFTYNQSGGTIHANTFNLGQGSLGATWNQTGGTNYFSDFQISPWSPTGSTYNLSGGSVTADIAQIGTGGPSTLNLSGTGALTVTNEYVGSWSGTGTLNQTGGTHNVGQLFVGFVLDGTGTFNLAGGSLTAVSEYIAFGNNQPGMVHGTFVQTGGTNTVTANLAIAYGGNSQGAFEMRGGTLAVPWLVVGQGTSGSFLQTAGQTTITAALFVGNLAGQLSTLTLSGGTLTSTGNAYVGYGSAATLNHDGGTFNVAGNLYVSGDGVDGNVPNGHGTYNLSGAAHLATGNLYVGYGSDGTFNQAGGTVDTGFFVRNGPSGTTGTVNKTGGDLNTSQVVDVLRPTAGGAGVVDEGSPYTLNLSATSSAGNNAINHWDVAWGDQLTSSITGNPPATQHTFTTGGVTRTINATATGGGRLYPSPPVNVLINPVPATITLDAGLDLNIDAGQPVHIATTFTDPGTGQTHTAYIEWGDGSTDTSAGGLTLTESGHTGSVSGQHVFNRHGTYTAILRVTDSTGAVASLPITINVNYVAPTFSMTPPTGTALTGQETTVTMKATGVEATGVTQWKVDWGDGTVTNYTDRSLASNANQAQWLAVHTYANAGTYSVHAWATDSAPAPHDAGVVTKTVTLAPATSAGENLSIRGASTGTVGSPLSFQISDGSAGPLASSLTYVWSVSKSGKTVATGTGLSFQFVPQAAGSYVAQVTEIGDPAGPFVATHAIDVTVPEGAILPIQGPSALEVGHIASFNFNQQTIWDHFGKQQFEAWRIEAGHTHSNNVGPRFNWTVKDAAGETVKDVEATLIWGNYEAYVSPTLKFSASQPDSYTVSLTITYNGKKYFQNAETLAAIPPSLANVTSNILDDTAPSHTAKGDSAVENADGSIIVVRQIDPYAPGTWSITKLNPDLSVDTSFGNFGSVQGPSLPYRGPYTDPVYIWEAKGAQVALQADGKFVIATHVLDDDGYRSEKVAYNNYNGYPYGPPQYSSIQAASVWIIARYNPDGTLDDTFGPMVPNSSNSKHTGIIIDTDSKLHGLESLAIQPDGRILVAGAGFAPLASGQPLFPGNPDGSGEGPRNRPAFLVKRYTADGIIDASFGTNGSSFVPVASDANLVRLGFGYPGEPEPYKVPLLGSESAMSLAVDPRGRIVVGGFSSLTHSVMDHDENDGLPAYDSKFALVRLNSNGSVDTSFGTQGRVITPFNDLGRVAAVIRDVGIDPSGNIIAMGNAGDQEFNFHDPYVNATFAIAKYKDDGSLDTAFGGPAAGGRVLSEFYGEEWSYAGTLTPTGDIVMAGETDSGGMIAKFKNDGTVDTRFGDDQARRGVETFNVSKPGTAMPANSYTNIFRDVLILRSKKNANDVFVVGSGVDPLRHADPWWGNTFVGSNEVVVARYHPTELGVSQLVATATPTGPIDLTWQNTGTGQDGFEIHRSTTPGGLNGSTSVIASVGPDQTAYTDVDVTPNTTYYYQIVAFKTAAGNVVQSDPAFYSNVASAVAAAVNTGYVLQEVVPVNFDGSTRVSNLVLKPGVVYMLQATGNISQTLDSTHRGDAENAYYPINDYAQWWDKAPDGSLAGYDFGIAVSGTAAASGNIYNKYPYWGDRSQDAKHTYSIMVVGNGQPIGLSYRDSYYPDNSSTNPGDKPLNVLIYRALPSSPGGLVATGDRDNRRVVLNWTNYAQDATKVLVQRTGEDGQFHTIATLKGNATEYADTMPAIAFNKLYSYRVIARGGFADSSPSNVAYAVLTNLAPKVQAIKTQVVYAGSDYKYQIIANDGDGHTTGLTYEITSGPEGLIVDAVTGQMTWTPPTGFEIGGWPGTVKVTDADGSSTTSSFLIVVGPPKDTIPTATVPAHVVSQTSTTLTLGVTGTVPANPGAAIKYTWSAVALPGAAGTPTFSKNGTTDASETVVTLHGAGNYQFQVSMEAADADPTIYAWPGTSYTPAIAVGQVLGSVAVTPAQARAQAGSAQLTSFRASAFDQFNQSFAQQPTFTWEILANTDGLKGSIDANGKYTPPAVGGFTATIKATAVSDGITQSAFAAITVSNDPLQAPVLDADMPDVTVLSFSELQLIASATDPLHPDSDSHLTYTWKTIDRPPNAPKPTFSINGTNAAKNAIATCSDLFPFNYTFEVTVENDQGLSTSRAITVTDDRTFNQIALTPKLGAVGFGKVIHYSAVAQDQFSRPLATQPAFAWSVDGVVVTGVTGSTFDYTSPTTAGQHTISVTATSDGIPQTTTIDLSVVGQQPPVLRIGGLSNSDPNKPVLIDKATDVQIVADDVNEEDTVSWRLWLVDSASKRTRLAGDQTRVGRLPDTFASVVKLNPEQLSDGVYKLQLTENNTSPVLDERVLEVHTQYKVGGLRLPFVDAQIEVPGAEPLTATRVYDSMTANIDGDFGFGWSLQMNVKPDTFRTTAYPGDYTYHGVPAFRTGDMVYLTTPDGQQHAFAFVPSKNGSAPGSNAAVSYSPRFVAVDGSRAELSVGSTSTLGNIYGSAIELRSNPSTGEWFYSIGTGNLGALAGYNPSKAAFNSLDNEAFKLKTDDGTVYNYNRSGVLQNSKDSNNNVVDYTNGVVAGDRHFSIRKDGNHITGISEDPNFSFAGSPDPTKFIEYTYDAAGDLHTVRDRAGNLTTFIYAYETVSGAPTHRLIGIKDARNVQVVTASYDPDTHLLNGLADAAGTGATVATAPLGNGQTAQATKDATGAKTELIYNDHGDVVREIKQVLNPSGTLKGYRVTVHAYAYGPNNASAWTQAEKFGVTNLNKLGDSKDYAPFVIAGPDSAGLRYTQTAPTLLSRTEFYQIDPADFNPAVHLASLFQPQRQSTLGADGQMRTTEFLKYAGPGKPTIIKDPHGQLTWLTYDTHGNLTHTINALGEGTETEYDTQGRVIATYRATGTGGSESALPAITRGVQLSATSYYTATDPEADKSVGKVKTTTDAAGVTTRYTYYSDGQAKAVFREWTDAQGPHSVRDSLTEYDAAGRVFKVMDAHGRVTTTHYDNAGRVAVTVDAYGGQTVSTYDARGQVIRTLYPDGTETRTSYDALGRAEWTSDRFVSTTTAQVSVNAATNVATVSYVNDTTTTALATRTLYDTLGRASGTERYKQAIITLATDGPLLKAVAPDVPTLLSAGRRLSTTGTAYDDQGRVKETKDATGLSTQTEYYPNGQVKRTRTVANSIASPWTVYDYDLGVSTVVKQAIADATGQVAVSCDSVTDANGHATTTYKDALGRTIRTAYADESYADVEYGAFGSTTKTYDQRKTTDTAAPTYTERQSDLSGRLTDVYLPAVTDADPTSATFNQSVRPHWVYAYDKTGNETGQLDPKGRLTSFGYDDLGQRTSRTMPPDSDGNTTNDTERWTYDGYGRTATHVDFKGQVTQYVYDDASLLADAGDPRLSLPAGHAVLGRLIEERRFASVAAYAAGLGTPAETTRYGYDPLGRQWAVAEYNGPADATPDRLTKTDYDPLTGGVIKVTSPEGVIEHHYNESTGRLDRTWTASNDTTYQYDPQGRLWKVIVNKLNGQALSTPQTTEYKDDPVDNLDLSTFDNGTPGTIPTATADDLKHDYEYDVLNRLDTLAVTRGTTALFDQDYDYESDGEKDKVTEHRGSVTTVYDWTYDAINRLTDETYANSGDATKSYAAHYGFDLSSNRVSKTQTGANAATTVNTYNDRDELASTQTNGGPVVIPQYDPDGNTFSDGTHTFTWDLRNRTASVTVNGTTTAYTYDHNGVRVSKKIGTGPTRNFVNDPLNPTGYSKPIEERVNGNVDTSYVIGLGVLGQSSQTTGYLSLVQDGQGKTRSVLNLSGVDVQPADYDAYGNTLQPGQTVTPWQNPDGYTDSETGFTRQGIRTLDRQTGEWTSQDPMIFGAGEWQDANLYSYVGGSPLLNSDPSGRFGIGQFATSFGISSVLARMTVGATLGVIDAHFRGYSYGQGAIGGAAFGALGPLIPAQFGLILGGLGVADALAAGEYDSALFRAATLGFGYALQNKGFPSFKAFKEFFGKPGNGKVYHHIVEQNPGNISRFGQQALQNPNNVAPLPHGANTVHAKISGFYSSKQEQLTGPGFSTVRQWLSTKSFEDQYRFGLETMARLSGRSNSMNLISPSSSWAWPAIIEPFQNIFLNDNENE